MGDRQEVDGSDDEKKIAPRIQQRGSDVCFGAPYDGNEGTRIWRQLIANAARIHASWSVSVYREISASVYHEIHRQLGGTRRFLRRYNGNWLVASEKYIEDKTKLYFDQDKTKLYFNQHKPNRVGLMVEEVVTATSVNSLRGDKSKVAMMPLVRDACSEEPYDRTQDTIVTKNLIHDQARGRKTDEANQSSNDPREMDVWLGKKGVGKPGSRAYQKVITDLVLERKRSAFDESVGLAVRARLPGRRFFVRNDTTGDWREANDEQFLAKVRMSYSKKVDRTQTPGAQVQNPVVSPLLRTNRRTPWASATRTPWASVTQDEGEEDEEDTKIAGSVHRRSTDICLGMNGRSQPGSIVYQNTVRALVVKRGPKKPWTPQLYDRIRSQLVGRRFLVEDGRHWREARTAEIMKKMAKSYENMNRYLRRASRPKQATRLVWDRSTASSDGCEKSDSVHDSSVPSKRRALIQKSVKEEKDWSERKPQAKKAKSAHSFASAACSPVHRAITSRRLVADAAVADDPPSSKLIPDDSGVLAFIAKCIVRCDKQMEAASNIGDGKRWTVANTTRQQLRQLQDLSFSGHYGLQAKTSGNDFSQAHSVLMRSSRSAEPFLKTYVYKLMDPIDD